MSTPRLAAGTRTAILTLGIIPVLGFPATLPGVVAIAQKPDRVLPRFDDDKQRGLRAFMFCYVMMDISEDELIAYLDADLDLDVYLQRLSPAAARRLQEFLVCAHVASLALRIRRPPVPPTRAAASAAQAGCTATAVRITLSRRGARVTRARSPRLRVGCAQTAAGMQVSLRPRKRTARLRRVIGPRLRVAVGRARSDSPQDGERLSVTTLQRR